MELRQRAELGISEVSDAVIVVISEETGQASIAHNGRIIRKQDPIRSQFLQLGFDFAGRPERLNVQIRVEGPESVMYQVSPAEFNAFIDLSQVPFGQPASVPVEITTTAADIELTNPIPEEVGVLMEQEVSHDIPVELDIRGGVACGHIVLFGPLAALDSLVDDDVRVTLDVFGLVSGTHSLAPVVDLPERGIKVRSIRPGSVSVVVTRIITSSDELTATLPVTETNNALLNALSRGDLTAEGASASTNGTPIFPAELSTLELPLAMGRFANVPERKIFI